MNTNQAPKFSPYERVIINIINDNLGQDGTCTMPASAIADQAVISHRGAQKILARLEAQGVINVERNCIPGKKGVRKTSSSYSLNA